jgi:hypothetical protein
MSPLGFALIAFAALVSGALPGILGSLLGKRLSEEGKRFLPVIGVAVALAIVIPIAYALRPGINWIAFASTEGGFHASFPGIPLPNTTRAGPPDKQVAVHQFVGSSANPPLECVVSYVDYTKESLGDKPEDVLARSRDGAAESGKGKITQEQPFTLAGYPGKAFKLEHDQGFVYTRLVLAKQRLYIVQVETLPNVPEPPEVAQFLDSFQLDR